MGHLKMPTSKCNKLTKDIGMGRIGRLPAAYSSGSIVQNSLEQGRNNTGGHWSGGKFSTAEAEYQILAQKHCE
jgi:hypothetical protein